MMNSLFIGMLILGFIAANVGASLLFKVAADQSGWTAIWYFVAGNFVGFLCPVTLTLALRGGNPNIIYAVCFGGGFCLLQMASYWFFKQPLSAWQWTGVAVTAVGILLLQIR